MSTVNSVLRFQNADLGCVLCVRCVQWNLHCPNREIIISALSIYIEKNIDFIDAYNAFMLKRDEIYEIYSYDKHFDRVGWIKRIEPLK